MNFAGELSEPLRTSRPVRVLKRSLERDRLAHGILLHGDKLETVEEVAQSIASVLLETQHSLSRHPDFFVLRPSRKARQIHIEHTRQLIRDINHSPLGKGRKVALIYEADRMNQAAANAFLKTLEEPPSNTTIILLSTRPYDLLDTVRSRCFKFRIPSDYGRIEDARWQKWLADYREWLQQLRRGHFDSEERARAVLCAYGLVARFQGILAEIGDERWKVEKTNLTGDVSGEEQDAAETGFRKGVRQLLLSEIERETRDFALGQLPDREVHPETDGIDSAPLEPPDRASISALIRVINELERARVLLELNLADAVALEYFFLVSLRHWTAPGR